MLATQPRTWLSARVGGVQPAPEPGLQLDDLHGHTWTRSADDGLMHTGDDRHVQTWRWLHEHADLVEVTGQADSEPAERAVIVLDGESGLRNGSPV